MYGKELGRGFAMRFAVWFTAGLLLAGCDKHPAKPVSRGDVALAGGRQSPAVMAQAQAKWFRGAPAPVAGVHLAYSHEVGVDVAGGAMAAHFVAARDRCVNEAALHCLLLHAELSGQQAELRVRLPHDQVAGFAEGLTQALPGESPGQVRVVRQATTAEDLGRPIADVAQRVAQLQQYLASLKSLGSRLTISVSDLVKIASETAQAQSQIEEVEAQQRELLLRVDTEELDVSFQELAPALAPHDPVAQVWGDSQELLRQNYADSLRFAIAALPWIPLGFIGLIALWIARRMVIGRRAQG